ISSRLSRCPRGVGSIHGARSMTGTASACSFCVPSHTHAPLDLGQKSCHNACCCRTTRKPRERLLESSWKKGYNGRHLQPFPPCVAATSCPVQEVDEASWRMSMARSASDPGSDPTAQLVGPSPAMHALRTQLRHLATFDTLGKAAAPTVLLQGETGT